MEINAGSHGAFVAHRLLGPGITRDLSLTEPTAIPRAMSRRAREKSEGLDMVTETALEPTLVWGPTYEEMLHPSSIDPAIRSKALETLKNDPLDKINLYNISWRDARDQIRYFVLPKELTGVDANIVALYAAGFPTGSHKVGSTYSVTVEARLPGDSSGSAYTGLSIDRELRIGGLGPAKDGLRHLGGFRTHESRKVRTHREPRRRIPETPAANPA